MTVVTISAKGQVVIPRDIRRRLGIQPSQKVTVELVENHVEIRPLPADPVKALRGMFSKYPGFLAQELVEERKREA